MKSIEAKKILRTYSLFQISLMFVLIPAAFNLGTVYTKAVPNWVQGSLMGLGIIFFISTIHPVAKMNRELKKIAKGK